MADLKKSPEIVTEQELKPVLESKTFDSKTFLDLYKSWKVTKDTGTFASLRAMHEKAGYNNKNIVFGAEDEMHEIAAIIQKYANERRVVVAGTSEAVSTTPRPQSFVIRENIPLITEANGSVVSGGIINSGETINLTIPINEKVVVTPNNKHLTIIEVQIKNMGKVWIPRESIEKYITLAPQPNQGAVSAEQQKETFAKIKEELDKKLKAPVTGPDVLADCELLRELKDPVARMYAVNWIVGNIIRSGFQVTLTGGKVDIIAVDKKTPTQVAKAAELERALSSSLASQSISHADIAQAILVGSGEKWATYVKSTANGVLITVGGYTQFLLESYKIEGKTNDEILRKVENNKSMTPSEKAYIKSAFGGGMGSVNIPHTLSTYNAGVQAGTDLFMTDAYQAIARVIGGTVPATPAAARQQAEAVLANPASATGSDGKQLSWILGGILAIFGLGYSKAEGFSFWTGLKRAFIGVIAVVGGCAIGREWKKELGFDLCDEAMKTMKDVMGKGKEAVAGAVSSVATQVTGSNGTPSTTPTATPAQAPANAPQSKVDVSKLGEEQKKAYETIKGDASLVQKINDLSAANTKNKKIETGDFEAYMSFVFSDKIQNLELEKLIYTKDSKQGIFSSEGTIALELGVPNNLDNNILKTLLRKYIIRETKLELVSGQPQGKRERDEFEKTYSANVYRKKTLHDITKIIYK